MFDCGKQVKEIQGELQGLSKATNDCFHDPSLTAIYSMHSHPSHSGLLAAAGKQGRVCVLSLDEDQHQEPLLSFAAHKGWVSDVCFVQTPCAERMLMLTSGNDAAVKVWDVSKCAAGIPRNLCTTKLLHNRGIFSMHATGTKILTAGKDACVVVSDLLDYASISECERFSNLHDRVVKSVRWRLSDGEARVFASAGDDARVCVLDHRAKVASLIMENVHETSVQSVRWHPRDENTMLTAGRDAFIKLHDIRRPNAPVYTFMGHHFSCNVKGIHHPDFYWGGGVIITGGEASTKVSMYCTQTGCTLSRGKRQLFSKK
jgi:WD40 repeat protein